MLLVLDHHMHHHYRGKGSSTSTSSSTTIKSLANIIIGEWLTSSINLIAEVTSRDESPVHNESSLHVRDEEVGDETSTMLAIGLEEVVEVRDWIIPVYYYYCYLTIGQGFDIQCDIMSFFPPVPVDSSLGCQTGMKGWDTSTVFVGVVGEIFCEKT